MQWQQRVRAVAWRRRRLLALRCVVARGHAHGYYYIVLYLSIAAPVRRANYYYY
jgi:hypothetical protein